MKQNRSYLQLPSIERREIDDRKGHKMRALATSSNNTAASRRAATGETTT